MWPRLAIIFLLVFVVTCNSPLQNETSQHIKSKEVKLPDEATLKRKAEWIDSIFTRLARYHWFNGAIIYGEKGHVIYKKAFGFSNFRTKDTLTIKSAFQLASISKMITAMAVMILKEEGKLRYENTIGLYFPEFPYPDITIKQLLTHRSGLSRYMSLSHNKWSNKNIPLSNDDVIDLFIRYKPNSYFRADNGFHYCNTNYVMLAAIVEKIADMPFDEFVNEKIFDPLGMDDSFVYNLRDDSIVPGYIPKGVTGHRYYKWRLIRQKNDYLNGVMGDKGVYTSIEDIFKFDNALNDLFLVGDSTLREAFSPGSPDYWKKDNNYGFGWRIKNTEDSTVYHFGWWKGFRAYYIRDMKQQKTIIALCNKDKGPASSILWKIIRDTTHVVRFNNFLISELVLEDLIE